MTDTDETATDAARRFAQRLFAVERLCSGRPGYHTITVKALLTAMSDADDEPAIAPQPETRFDPQVQGCCPACGLAALFLGEGGYVTCANLPCQEPDAASTLLERRPAPQPETAPRPAVGIINTQTGRGVATGGNALTADARGVPDALRRYREEIAPDAERHSFQDGFCARCGVEHDGWDLEQSETAHTACRPATAPDAAAPWGRGQDGKPFLPMGAHWTDIPELRDRRIAEIQARLGRAQRGAWFVPDGQPDLVCTQYDGYTHTVGRMTTLQDADLALILHAHTDLVWCLDMIAKLCTPPDAEPGTPDLRQRYAAAIREAISAWDADVPGTEGVSMHDYLARAVLAVRDDALTTAQRAAETAEHVARQNLDHYRQTYRDYQRLEAELVTARSQIDRLRTYATATELRHTQIRDHLATLDIRTRSDAWSLGAHIIAILDSPPDGLNAALTPRDTSAGQDGGAR